MFNLLSTRTLSPCKAAFHPVVLQLVLCHGIASSQVQDFAPASVELHEISLVVFLVKCPLKSSPAPQCTSRSLLFSTSNGLDDHVKHLIVQVIIKGIKTVSSSPLSALWECCW